MFRFRCFGRCVIVVLVCLGFGQATAQSFADFAEFQRFIVQKTRQQIPHRAEERMDVTVTQLDKTMKLPTCSMPIETFVAQQDVANAPTSIKLECMGDARWTLYVPIKIRLIAEVVTAAHMIRPMDYIDARDVVLKQRDTSDLTSGYFTQIKDVVGQSAATFIPAGALVRPKNIKRIPLVKRNQSVILALQHQSIEINMTGIAKTDGYLHDTIKIMNPSSKKIVDAEVVSKGKVLIQY